jgi:hypothetical protein
LNTPAPPDAPTQPRSCWLRGCMILAMVVPTIMLLLMVGMLISRAG